MQRRLFPTAVAVPHCSSSLKTKESRRSLISFSQGKSSYIKVRQPRHDAAAHTYTHIRTHTHAHTHTPSIPQVAVLTDRRTSPQTKENTKQTLKEHKLYRLHPGFLPSSGDHSHDRRHSLSRPGRRLYRRSPGRSGGAHACVERPPAAGDVWRGRTSLTFKRGKEKKKRRKFYPFRRQILSTRFLPSAAPLRRRSRPPPTPCLGAAHSLRPTRRQRTGCGARGGGLAQAKAANRTRGEHRTRKAPALFFLSLPLFLRLCFLAPCGLSRLAPAVLRPCISHFTRTAALRRLRRCGSAARGERGLSFGLSHRPPPSRALRCGSLAEGHTHPLPPLLSLSPSLSLSLSSAAFSFSVSFSLSLALSLPLTKGDDTRSLSLFFLSSPVLFLLCAFHLSPSFSLPLSSRCGPRCIPVSAAAARAGAEGGHSFLRNRRNARAPSLSFLRRSVSPSVL